MAINDNIMNWKNIRGEVNSIKKDAKEAVETANEALEGVQGAMDAAEAAAEKADEAKGAAEDASGAVDALKTALNGVYAFVQFNKSIAVADWAQNEATVESDYFKSQNMITIEPAVDADGGNTDEIINAGITPLEITTQGEITFICKDVPSEAVVFTFVVGIPVDLSE